MKLSDAKADARAARLRQLPSVDELLRRPRLAGLARQVGRGVVVDLAREVLDDLRSRVTGDAELAPAEFEVGRLEERVAAAVAGALAFSLRPVINATGVVLHTNLGRAPLAGSTIAHLRDAATQYSNLEYDLAAGRRGTRDAHTGRLLARVLGAEAALLVNNNAAAVLLVLHALAKGGEVIVSRGELVEIGDTFRIPDIMAASGAILREVGTTNRTRLADYEDAVNERTRLLLRVHPSNFRIVGFTERASLPELVDLGRRAGVPVFEDLGSGCLVDLSACGFDEPTARASLEAGAAVVSFSGDKLLGGPQAGVIAGRREPVAHIRRNPLFRALRVDKLTVAAMEATLHAYLRGAHDEIPALRMIRLPVAELDRRARAFVERLGALLPAAADLRIEIGDGASLLGGGSTPGQQLPTRVIAIASARHSAAALEQRLRAPGAGLPVVARVEDDRLVLDLRTVFPEQEAALAAAVAEALR